MIFLIDFFKFHVFKKVGQNLPHLWGIGFNYFYEWWLMTEYSAGQSWRSLNTHYHHNHHHNHHQQQDNGFHLDPWIHHLHFNNNIIHHLCHNHHYHNKTKQTAEPNITKPTQTMQNRIKLSKTTLIWANFCCNDFLLYSCEPILNVC